MQDNDLNNNSGSQSVNPSNRPLDLINTKEMCGYLGIGVSTSYDWRSQKSVRYKPDFPTAYHLTPKSVRFSRQDIIDWVMKHKRGVQS